MSGNSVRPHADDLAAAITAELSAHHRVAGLAGAAARLMAVYRSGDPTPSPALDTPAAVLAYAAYRMPATHAAVAAALAAATAPGLAPRTLLDIGGGTGAAVWAAAAVYPTLTSATVLDRSGPALQLGRRLAARAQPELPRATTWARTELWRPASGAGAGLPRAAPAPSVALPPADLVTMAYVLAELPDAAAAALVDAAARRAALVAVVEPGTPAGHRRVLAARRRLLGHGLHLLAPCPQETDCPLDGGRDWCHFGVRLDRTPTHRRLKGGSLGHEDEKFAYVVAARAAPATRMGRIVRRPLHRPGVVHLEVCTPADGVRRSLVSRRQGTNYRAARQASWGDLWQPGDETTG
jgi:ribosomal protein RSM22 (predicted rRNA methylase)